MSKEEPTPTGKWTGVHEDWCRDDRIRYEKRIAELEKDKAYLDESLDKQIQATLDLQKENAELKEQLNFKTRFVKGEKAIEQLAQAKELLKKWLGLFHEDVKPWFKELFDSTEQFLNKGCPDVLCEDCKKDCPIEKIKE